MAAKDPFARVHVFLAKDEDPATKHLGHWRLYWRRKPWPPWLSRYADENLEVFPVAAPDFEDLDRLMLALDAPYRKRVDERGNVELEASEFAGVWLAEWLMGLFVR